MEKHSKSRINDPVVLQKIIATLEEERREEKQIYQKKIEQLIEDHKKEIVYKNCEIEKLRFQLNKQLHNRFASKSEQSQFVQADLFDEAKPTDFAAADVEQAEQDIQIPKEHQKKRGRKPLPENLPREEKVYDLPPEEKTCACGHVLHKIGEDISEQLEIIPAQVKVIRHVRCKYACRQCEEGVINAPLPATPIPKSFATVGMLSHVLTSKYVDHLPLYRQEQIFKRLGVDMVRSTMSHWVIRCAELLEPIVVHLKKAIRGCNYIQADETHLQVLGEPDRSNQSKSYLWGYRGVDPPDGVSIVFEYQETRAAKHAQNFLKSFKGYLQTDGYQGYNELRKQSSIEGYGCMAHVRRKFVDISRVMKKKGKADEAIAFIKYFYAVENEARKNSLSMEKRKQLRLEKSLPMLTKLYDWLIQTQRQAPPKSALGGAIAYTLSQWEYVSKYAQTGHIEIDNNLIENAIRPFALGRKSWLFLGSVDGAKASAIFFSLAQTCKANNVEPYAYFKVALQEVLECKSDDDYKKLMPQAIDREKLTQAYQ